MSNQMLFKEPYEVFIGLEIHVQLGTNSKVFCNCNNSFGSRPNENICPICLGYPGVLPALNAKAIEHSYVIAKALDCSFSKKVIFERKNYFYPDLPKNYQISQYENPLGKNGKFLTETNEKTHLVRIRQVHLEEDAGKMIHAGEVSLLDYNRTGTPLVEVVTEPDLHSPLAAEQFVEAFRRLVRYLRVSDGNMEEGSLRCDANVSVNYKGSGLGKKVEIKNLNSFKFVRNSLQFEIERQIITLKQGEIVKEETRLWNENRGCTEIMRLKESEDDYRYFPEPDLQSFVPDLDFLYSVENQMVELPLDRRNRFMTDYGLNREQAAFLTNESQTAQFFEDSVAEGADPDLVAKWMGSDIQRNLNQRRESLEVSFLSPKRLSELLELMTAGTINGKIAKKILDLVFKDDCDPKDLVEQNGYVQIVDEEALSNILTQVLEEHPPVKTQITNGIRKPIGFLIGQVMKATKGKADPKTLSSLVESLYKK